MEQQQRERNLQVHMVSHVHWDPMWYSSYQEYRIRLYRLMKRLIAMLENNPEYKYFMLDGQVQIVDDYLEVAPEDEGKIKRWIREGRLFIGPWYVQPEEFLVSGETHIRNLKMGMERAEQLGGCMKVSYLCDPVGHIAQLPQILRGFGIDYFVAARGTLDNNSIKKTEFFWEAPDSSRVLVHTMPYYNSLAAGREEFIQGYRQTLEKMTPLHQTEYILYLQGVDHAEAREEILEFIKEFNRREGREVIVPVTLEQHMKAVESRSEQLYIHRGELRNAFWAPMLQGILSTRMEIKLKNAQNQTHLEKWAEPFSTVHWLLGGEYPEPFLNLAWKLQVRNSFHDCIYGAHADHVTPDIMNIYKQSEEVIRWHANQALYGIAAKASTEGSGPAVVCFNPSARDREEQVVDFDLYFDTPGALNKVRFISADGESLPYQVNSLEKTISLSKEAGNRTGEHLEGEPYQFNVSALLRHIPAVGYTVFTLREGEPETYKAHISAYANGCETRDLKLEINSDGTVDVTDKMTGKSYSGLHYFQDAGDRGDQYNFSATVPQGIISSKGGTAAVALVHCGPVKAVFKVEMDFSLPEGLDLHSEGRSRRHVNNKITYYITVRAFSRCVEFHTAIHNISKDHKLTVVFPTGIKTEAVSAGSQFCVLKRDRALPRAEDWREKPSEFRPHHRFVQMHDAGKGFTFMDRGLTEHKVTENGDVYITLLRCTGYLSKNTLPERNYTHAGPGMETPLAQEMGRFEYDYSLYFHEGDWEKAQSQYKSDEFNTPVKCIFIPKPAEKTEEGDALPQQFSFLRMDGQGVLLSALKKGRGCSTVVRLYNTSGQEVATAIRFYKDIKTAHRVDLAEKPLEGLKVEGKVVQLNIPGNKIVTLSVAFQSGTGDGQGGGMSR